MTAKAPGQAAYEGMTAEAVKQRGGPSPFPAWRDLEDWQRKRWEAAENAGGKGDRARIERLTASRDRAMDALAAVRTALGWDDSRWVEWLASSDLPIPWELARTVTMIGQGPDLAKDVHRLADEAERLKESFRASEDEAATFKAVCIDALALIAVLADGKPDARRQANELRRRAGLREAS